MNTQNNNVVDLRTRELLQERVAKNSDGGDNGNMDGWKQSVENRLGQLHTDIKDAQKFLLLAYGAGFIILLGVLAKGFNWI